MHFVVMGAGRVGIALASLLDERGHSVAIIDRNPDAFRKLPASFTGRRVTGIGFDRDTLKQAGIEKAYAFAAVSNGDNSNIISARVVRETFNIDRVVARIYDPTRAEVYERLGIPTVATVRRTTEAVLSWMLPPDTDEVWTHPTGAVSLAKIRPADGWLGYSIDKLEKLVGHRVVFISRLGIVQEVKSGLVLQENDVLYIAISGHEVVPVRDLLVKSPPAEV
ncbi:TrkA family potassium uptake protein [Gleimia sp. 6138-11-ORH1]|uniref:potassium channel family protein n=1 Tax=Gleimia sp. 6138-11-ORH1 TaxID=2973937 RepID=UPI002168414A|nr:TrkA family potassium uptake protein [Gleimia sp. 6138-11-ORH1]MCS4484429.1 TrkA family potassium uptake protein [Gleimia sp. 6138-11-ORH1]